MRILMDQGMKHRGITEDLKKKDQMEWIRHVNNLQHSAEENIKHELIYC
ncbi:TnpV protein [Solobacterium moorei]|uniref:TnpV protein n=2 Tax=Solobacterium moorei TaxID=102148 RepID=A0A412PBL6_9FIRM|nr:TnpV protein [Solobacterium moorei]